MVSGRSSRAVHDSGWSWVIAGACCWVTFVILGLVRCSGVIYVSIIDTFEVNRGQASWPFTLRLALWNLSGPIAGALSYKWSIRTISIVGIVLVAIGYVACWFASDLIVVTLFLGIVQGLGVGISSTLIPVLINQYFVKYKTTGAGIACAGSTAGSFALSPVVEMIIEEYGLRGAFLMMGGLTLQGLLGAALMRPAHWLETPRQLRIEKDGMKKRQRDDSNKLELPSYEVKPFLTKEEKQARNSENKVETHCTDLRLNHRCGKCTTLKQNNVKLLDANCQIGMLKTDLSQKETGRSDTTYLDSSRDHTSEVNPNQAVKYPESIDDSPLYQDLPKTQERNGEASNYHALGEEHSDSESSFLCSSGRGLVQLKEYHPLHGKQQTNRNFSNIHLDISGSKLLSEKTKEVNCYSPISGGNLENSYSCLQVTSAADTPLQEKRFKLSEKWRSKLESLLEPIRMASLIISNPIFILIASNYTFFFISYMTYLIVIVDYAQDLHHNTTDSVFLVSMFSISDFCGRLGSGWITDSGLIRRRNLLMINMALVGSLFITLSLIESYMSLTTVTIATGLIVGMNLIIFYALLEECLGLEKLALAIGLMNFSIGCFYLVTPVLTGYFRDTLGTYTYLFRFLGACSIFSGLLWTLEPVKNYCQKLPKTDNEENESRVFAD